MRDYEQLNRRKRKISTYTLGERLRRHERNKNGGGRTEPVRVGNGGGDAELVGREEEERG